MATKAIKEDVIQVESVIPAGFRTLGSLNPGDQFKIQGRAYIKYGTTKGIVAVEPTSDHEEVLRLPEDTIVDI